MQINIKLKGSTVSVHPSTAELTGGGNQTLQWSAKDDSDEFDFDNPPITFESTAPISGISATGDNASATDDASTAGEFTYQVHLIDSSGNHITWPSTSTARGSAPRNSLAAGAMNVMLAGDPTIKNKPGGA